MDPARAAKQVLPLMGVKMYLKSIYYQLLNKNLKRVMTVGNYFYVKGI